MATEDETRRELYDLLEASIGARGAALLMTYLPPTGWTELATRQDLAVTHADMTALRAELRGEMAELRGEMAELRGEMAEIRGEVRELRGELRSQLPKLIAANIASMIGVGGLVLAAGAAL